MRGFYSKGGKGDWVWRQQLSLPVSQTDFRAAILFLAPPPLPPVLGPLPPLHTDSVAFLGFCSANQITFLTFPTLGQGSDSFNLLCHLQLMDLLSSLQSFMAVVFLLTFFSLKIYSFIKETFHSYFNDLGFWEQVMIKYVCLASFKQFQFHQF